MRPTGPELPRLRRELAGIAASPATVQERAAQVLEHLRRIVPFDAGWLAVRDAERHRHLPLATTGAVAPLREYFDRPDADEELDRLGLNRCRPPLLASEMPVPLSEVCAWAEHLLPAGFRQGMAAPLCTPGGRHVGFLALISADPSRPGPADQRLIAAVTTVIAGDIDRTRDIADTAAIVGRATAGVVLTRGGDVVPLPGLPHDPLLVAGSPVLAVAADEVADSGVHTSFLAPAPGSGGEHLIRVTVLDCARPDLDHLSAAVLLSPPGELHGLGVPDLRVLGLLAEGRTDVRALAQALNVGVEAVTRSLGRSMEALGTSDLTATAVRVLRGGLRIPPRLGTPP